MRFFFLLLYVFSFSTIALVFVSCFPPPLAVRVIHSDSWQDPPGRTAATSTLFAVARRKQVAAHAGGNLDFFIKFHIYCQELKQVSGDTVDHFPSPPSVFTFDLPHIVTAFPCVSYVDVAAQHSMLSEGFLVRYPHVLSVDHIACLLSVMRRYFLSSFSLVFHFALPSLSKDMP